MYDRLLGYAIRAHNLLKNKAMSGREWIGILILSMSTDVSYIYTNSTYTGTSRPQHSQPFPPP
jgi:hypothetical protein